MSFPVPPFELRERVGCGGEDLDGAGYEMIGRSCRAEILAALPPAWDWSGKRVLDFGCGAGRTLRHFGGEAHAAEFWGCDLHPPSIGWLSENIGAPMRFFVNRPEPHLDLPSGYFDLIVALSVFTHIDEHWASWLLELRRTLAPDGLLAATFLGPAMAETISGRPWDPASTGMNVYSFATSSAEIFPNVLHSEWWLRAHWGRAFEVVSLKDRGFGLPDGTDPQRPSHGWVVMRKRPQPCSAAELEALEPDEPREWAAVLRGRAEAVAEARAQAAARVLLEADLARLAAAGPAG